MLEIIQLIKPYFELRAHDVQITQLMKGVCLVTY